MSPLPFVKMQGIGNDFVMVDAIRNPLPEEGLAPLARAVCDRQFGIGGDGLILLLHGDTAPFRMRMLNPDGSESEMCGNGIRCFAHLLRRLGYLERDEVDVETGAGCLRLEIVPGGVRVDMGVARLTRAEVGMTGSPGERFVEEPLPEAPELRGTAVSMGNPHLVVFVDDVAAVDLKSLGPVLERSSLFPQRVNAHFVQVNDEGLVQRTWERGAGATLACGTGACASAVAGVLTGRSPRDVMVRLPGGTLRIEYAEDGRVFMTGPAETAFEGIWPG